MDVRITLALWVALVLVGCSSEAVVVGPAVPTTEATLEPVAPADAPSAKTAASDAPSEEPTAPVEPAPGLAEPEGQSDLQIAAVMTSALQGHKREQEQKRAESDARFQEMMNRPMSDPFGMGGLGGLGTSGSGMGGGGMGGLGGSGAIGIGGGGSGGTIGLGTLGTGSGGTSKPKTPPKKPAKPKAPPKK